MGDLSPHFSRREFADHYTGEVKGPDPELVAVLERLRSIDGRPLRVVSGYRSPGTNRRVGGARSSQHLVGRAADLEAGRFTLDDAVAAGATGIGVCDGWVVHVDVRPTHSIVTFVDCPRHKVAWP